MGGRDILKIIAEIGSNWSTVRDQIDSVKMAADLGADAVKFQFFDAKELYGGRRDMGPRQEPNVPVLAEVAEECGIEFMCTAFSRVGVEFVDQFVRTHKIASAEMLDPEILAAVRKTRKPTILSTGGHTLAEVKQAVDFFGDGYPLTVMYCESAYPSTSIDPDKIELLKDAFPDLPLGLSDHSRELYLTLWLAEQMGLSVVEKHVNLVGAQGPDAPHSLSADDFRRFLDWAEGVPEDCDLLSPEEEDMVVRHNRRLIVLEPVFQGEPLIWKENFASHRGLTDNAHAISPFDWHRINGKLATRDLEQFEAITEGDFE